ncbi:MAG TPA: inositol monophosphatase family protein [Verrucomicrobiota bacterium]|nr:inositol phosphatase [Verrucomicrobiales bacterium]HRI11745.1 inositol monophosphatase family protein [Verrucomicrobiota bacterium]
MKWQAEMALASDAARLAADVLLGTFSHDAGVRSQIGKDIKTRADIDAEGLITRHLSVSGLPIVGEETARDTSPTEGLRWLVDPLDGTMNFTRGFPMHAVSIALWDGPTPVLGVIYDLPRRLLYTGCCGVGAWRDGKPIRVSETDRSDQAILATGFPTGRDYGARSLESFILRVQAFKKIRMIGSAVLSLVMVAEGVFDTYLEEDIMIWDVAAGLALVNSAGGTIKMTAGRRPHAVTASATNGRIHV